MEVTFPSVGYHFATTANFGANANKKIIRKNHEKYTLEATYFGGRDEIVIVPSYIEYKIDVIPVV